MKYLFAFACTKSFALPYLYLNLPFYLIFVFLITYPFLLWGTGQVSEWDPSCQPGSTHYKDFHRITESQNGRGWKGPLWVI